MKKLKEQRATNTISETEYEQKRTEILKDMSGILKVILSAVSLEIV